MVRAFFSFLAVFSLITAIWIAYVLSNVGPGSNPDDIATVQVIGLCMCAASFLGFVGAALFGEPGRYPHD